MEMKADHDYLAFLRTLKHTCVVLVDDFRHWIPGCSSATNSGGMQYGVIQYRLVRDSCCTWQIKSFGHEQTYIVSLHVAGHVKALCLWAQIPFNLVEG
jgi:hypothetical protein